MSTLTDFGIDGKAPRLKRSIDVAGDYLIDSRFADDRMALRRPLD